MPGRTLYRHVIVDEAQDLHPAQWRLLRAAVAPGHDDMFLAADPHQRIYDNRVSLTSMGMAVRGRSRRLTVNYRTTAEILAWTVPLLGAAPVSGLDGEVDTLRGYRSPVHGRRPEVHAAGSREDEFAALVSRVRSWLDAGVEPHAIGVAARSGAIATQARDALKAARIPTLALTTQSTKNAVRVGTMHRMKGLEFQAVAVIGVDQAVVPAGSAVTPLTEDWLAHDQDLQRERCVLFVACTRGRDQLYVSYTGSPSPFLPA
jgi:superfamily I DNA/RNA helicase